MASERDAQRAGGGGAGGRLVIHIGDRESDSYEPFLQHQQERAAQKEGATRHELLLRCQHDRGLMHDADGLFSHLQKQPVAARMSITVPRRPGRKARTVTLAIRLAPVRFGPPAQPV